MAKIRILAGLSIRVKRLDIQGEIGVKLLLLGSQLRWFGYLIRMPTGRFL